MPAYTMRFRLPEKISPGIAASRFYWSPNDLGSFISPFGPGLGLLGPVPEPNIELVRLAVMVYAADRSTPRRAGSSNWSCRDLDIEVPVQRPERWEPVRERLEALLGFLSGDAWTLQFRQATTPTEQVSAYRYGGAKRVVLASGGADSTIGALMSRHGLRDATHILVSHVGATNIAPVQRNIVQQIGALIAGPEQFHRQIRFSRRQMQPGGFPFHNEYSTRTRSLLFLALGLAVASIERLPLWIPENGFASLNPPMTSDQRGTLSTRTTHPLFLQQLSDLATEAGAHAEIENPFALMTKGEMFGMAADLVGLDAASSLLSATHSCAHTGHRSHRLPVSSHCGVCFGCLLRRASFLASGVPDRTNYLVNHEARPEAYLRNKSVEASIRHFVTRGLRPSDVSVLSLPPWYSTQDAYGLCKRGITELELLFA
ncbi:7-cyano-7-deazaguanine synthase [Micromonospora globbae]|uniref:7-cyano-7-deazaguanine synthase n=1 Tax=Micromonospora globbae TaxID=1894969 RepID=A0A420EJV8_9ACTN|nr:7-cyano-7-deazaguanine synthase [Micromonospora globbae]RKF20954.1 hypothetical protein D7I43_31695 [Micromonospora globbae]